MKRTIALLLALLASAGVAIAADARAPRAGTQADHVAKNDVVDINSASEKELKSLPGVSTLRAKAIVHGRPYRAKEELVDKRILPEGVYEKVKDRMTAQHATGPGGSQ